MGRSDVPQKSYQILNLTVRVQKTLNFGLTKYAFTILGSPSHLEFWWCEASQMVFIGPGTEDSVCSMKIPRFVYRQCDGGSKMAHKHLIRFLCERYGWENNTYAKLTGEYLPELNMIAFKLNSVSVQG
jgi:hypothetical protein